MKFKSVLTAAFAVAAGLQLSAAVKPAAIFSSNMVLQRDMNVPVWGVADPGEDVTVTFAGQTLKTKADAKGNWTVTLKPMTVSKENRVMDIKGKNAIQLKNILVGDVWLCSGQSNMEMSFSWGVIDGEKFKKESAKYPIIRTVKFPRITAALPQSTVVCGPWRVCDAKNLHTTTATGYFFALELVKNLDIPIGLLDDNWSGCRIEPFIAQEGFASVKELANYTKAIQSIDPKTNAGKATWNKYIAANEKWTAEAKKAIAAGENPPAVPAAPGIGGTCNQYNAMIAPIVRFPIKGALWYQGCSNGGEGISYYHKTQALVNGWRKVWGYDFPFYFVQLASFTPKTTDPAGGNGYARIRNAQRMSLQIPKTGMAVAIDIGNDRDIHPKNKYDVGKRLALWALAKDYGKKDLVCSGPLYKGIKVEGSKIRISFDFAETGLMAGEKVNLNPVKELPGAKLTGFAIAGKDKKWYWANAVIDGKDVVVSAPEVKAPVAVRYAFRANPMGNCNLYNKAGLPASPFRTDNW